MARNIVFFLMVGIFPGALTGLAAAGVTGGVSMGAVEERIAAEARVAAVGGVADYNAENDPGSLTQERGPVETGALPAMAEGSDNDAPTEEISGRAYRGGIDDGP